MIYSRFLTRPSAPSSDPSPFGGDKENAIFYKLEKKRHESTKFELKM
jgi:hypothetical protein